MIFLKALPGGGVFFVREWIWRWISLIGGWDFVFWGDVGEKRTPEGDCIGPGRDSVGGNY